jgi:hypothetical protein
MIAWFQSTARPGAAPGELSRSKRGRSMVARTSDSGRVAYRCRGRELFSEGKTRNGSRGVRANSGERLQFSRTGRPAVCRNTVLLPGDAKPAGCPRGPTTGPGTRQREYRRGRPVWENGP